MNALSLALSLLALASLFGGLLRPACAERLEEVLAKHRVPLENFSAAERAHTITSYAASEGDAPFLLAYYDDDGSGLLKAPLHILRYDGRNGLKRAELRGVDEMAPGAMHQLSTSCLGSVLSVQENAGLVFIDTHINPSAGCVLILSPTLQFKVALWGWTLGFLDHFLMLHGNEVHFADTHPLTVDVYDWKAETLLEVYPPKNDPRRKSFSAALASRLPTEEWCRNQNVPCDPSQFSGDISDLKIDEAALSFSFTATMSPEGFGDKAEREVSSEAVRYVFHRVGGKWIHTEAAAK